MDTTKLGIPADGVTLEGDLRQSGKSKGLVIFTHGSGSSRVNPRNRFVAEKLAQDGFSTLLFDLLTPDETVDCERRFDISLLSRRLIRITQWILSNQSTHKPKIGYFGTSTGVASALEAAVVLGPEIVKAVVSRGGRPDLAMPMLEGVKSPTLLLIGALDRQVIKLNQKAFKWLSCEKKLTIIPGASHLFVEPGTLGQATRQASIWFEKYLYRRGVEIEKDFI